MGSFSSVDLNGYDTDKSRAYLDAYEREIGHLTEAPVRILELGIRKGGSLLLWRDLFPLGEVVGLDLLPVKVPDDTGRVHTYVGYQQDVDILDQLALERAPYGFDVIIDDASHVGTYTAESFRHLFVNHLKPGGVYVLEDWSCGYLPHWPDGAAFTSVNVLSPDASARGDASRKPGPVERWHRRVRALAPVVSRRLDSLPELKDRLRKLYMKAEGTVLAREFPSHSSGMVGLVKQIIDTCAVESIDPDRSKSSGLIQSVHVGPSVVFVHKDTTP